MTIVISQPMYFPWCGLLDLIRNCNVFVHYDDVQYSRGFFNRVQIKSPNSSSWMSVPLRQHHRGDLIMDCKINNSVNWQSKHLSLFRQNYRNAPYLTDAIDLMTHLFDCECKDISQVSSKSVELLAGYFNFCDVRYLFSSELSTPGSSSQRLLDICLKLNSQSYVSGHGGLKYLDHSLFDDSGVEVSYLNYQLGPWPQLHGTFTPFVSSLDAIANLGPQCPEVLKSFPVLWSDAVERPSSLSATVY